MANQQRRWYDNVKRRLKESPKQSWHWILTHPVDIVAQVVFLTVSAVFAYIFYAIEPIANNNGNVPISVAGWEVVYFGVAITLWSSFHSAYDFSVRQAANVSHWLRGLSIVVMGFIVSVCLIAMATHRQPLEHSICVHLALLSYVIWDLFLFRFYRKTSPGWYDKYKFMLYMDILIFLLFFPVYVPFVLGMPVAAWTISLEAVALWGTVVIYTFFSIYTAKAPENILSVGQGYKLIANVYDKGNAVMTVERRHTNARLQTLPTTGTIVDFGCGTGYYTSKLLNSATMVYAIDQSKQMLAELRTNTNNSPKCVIYEGGIGELSKIPDSTVSLVLMCLIIDHISTSDLEFSIKQTYRILQEGGILYITDVNPYFEILKEPFAKFVDPDGIGRRIEVIPHTIPYVVEVIRSQPFSSAEIADVPVTSDDAEGRAELREMASTGFPLIIEYSAIK